MTERSVLAVMILKKCHDGVAALLMLTFYRATDSFGDPVTQR